MVHVLGPLQLHWKPARSSWLLSLDHSNSSHCSHLESEQADESMLIFSFHPNTSRYHLFGRSETTRAKTQNRTPCYKFPQDNFYLTTDTKITDMKLDSNGKTNLVRQTSCAVHNDLDCDFSEYVRRHFYYVKALFYFLLFHTRQKIELYPTVPGLKEHSDSIA